MILENLPARLWWILPAISLGQCKIADFKCLIKVPLPPVLPAVADTCTLGICLPNTKGSQQWCKESSHLPCCSSNAFRSMLHRGCFYSLKNFKETIWMLTQMTVAVCPNHPNLHYIPCQSRDLAVSTAPRATRLLSDQQDSPLRHKAVPSSLPAALTLSLLWGSKISAPRNNLSASQEWCVMWMIQTFPKPFSKSSDTCREKCTITF